MNKAYSVIGVVMFICMLIIPLVAVKSNDENAIQVNATVATSDSVTDVTDKDELGTVRLLDNESGDISVLNIYDYIKGVVACEMPLSYETEALKAQAIAAYTITLYRINENSSKNYDITSDSSTDQGYIDEDTRKAKWSSNYEKYEEKIDGILDEVLYQAVTYKDKPILAVYHAISGGRTESSKNVWNIDLPYLKPVESVSDMLCSDYISTVTYTKEEFISLATNLGITLTGNAEDFISEPTCTDSGTVSVYKLAGKTFTGQQIRKAFNLRSANFGLSVSNGKLVFTVRGYGHGVGMSQNGANYMAKQGSNYKEILKWYYTGCEIKQIIG